MHLPNLTREDILGAFPEVTEVGDPSSGGQKIVFPCVIDGERFALKVMLTNPTAGPAQPDVSLDDLDEVTARAQREVDIMETIDSPHLIKLGPLPFRQMEIADQHVVCFTEEWIDGQDLRANTDPANPLSIADVVRLGKDIADAVRGLWQAQKIHRDIKPGNIMRRASGEFVLLDMGMAFDLDDISLTGPGMIAGTLIYWSPEQTDYNQRRLLDFRSDLFSLGVVMYQVATGRHPFWTPGMSSRQAVANMLGVPASRPSTIRQDVPPQLDGVLMRVLAKRPHLRYRTCEKFVDALDAVPA